MGLFGTEHRSFPLQGIRYGALLVVVLLSSCYSTRWNEVHTKETAPPPPEIFELFSSLPDGIMRLSASSPGYDYNYDIGEKDHNYSETDKALRFETVELTLHDRMPAGTVVVDFRFKDGDGNTVLIEAVDLLRLTPRMDTHDDMRNPEIILEEFNRFGINFRKEHNEFEIIRATDPVHQVDSAIERAYRANITNNCLAPTKWEFAITTADFSDFDQRRKGDVNINQNRILAHSWFYLDRELYQTLLNLKNPGNSYSVNINPDSLIDLAENTVIDFEKLRQPLKMPMGIELLEVGHKSNRKIEPLDVEEYYKWQFGLMMTKIPDLTYRTILEQPIEIMQFRDEGFYSAATPKVFDFSWLQYLDSVAISSVDVSESDCYVQITLSGKWAPYNITIGNVDLARLDEQKLFGMLFGFNTYPKSRRFNPQQNTTAYDAELLPDELKPYVLLTDAKTGKWVNNQYKGVEKVYLSYETLEKEVLTIHLLSYERIVPVWMSRVKLPVTTREMVRIRNGLYNY